MIMIKVDQIDLAARLQARSEIKIESAPSFATVVSPRPGQGDERRGVPNVRAEWVCLELSLPLPVARRSTVGRTWGCFCLHGVAPARPQPLVD